MKKNILWFVVLINVFLCNNYCYAGGGQSRPEVAEEGLSSKQLSFRIPSRIKQLPTDPVEGAVANLHLEEFEKLLRRGLEEKTQSQDSSLLDLVKYHIMPCAPQGFNFDKTLLTIEFERPVFGDFFPLGNTNSSANEPTQEETRAIFTHARINQSEEPVIVTVKREISETLGYEWILSTQTTHEANIGFTLGYKDIASLNLSARAEYATAQTHSTTTSNTKNVGVEEQMIVPARKKGIFTFREVRKTTTVPFRAKVHISGNVIYQTPDNVIHKVGLTQFFSENCSSLTEYKYHEGSYITFIAEGKLRLISFPSFEADVEFRDI